MTDWRMYLTYTDRPSLQRSRGESFRNCPIYLYTIIHTYVCFDCFPFPLVMRYPVHMVLRRTRRFFPSLIGFNPRRLKAATNGMSNGPTCLRKIFFFCAQQVSDEKNNNYIPLSSALMHALSLSTTRLKTMHRQPPNYIIQYTAHYIHARWADKHAHGHFLPRQITRSACTVSDQVLTGCMDETDDRPISALPVQINCSHYAFSAR